MNKKAKVCVLAVALFGLGFGSQAIRSGIPWPTLQSFVVEGGVWGLNLVLFIFGSVLIMGAGKSGPQDLSVGCAFGTGIFFVLVIGVAALIFFDILTW